VTPARDIWGWLTPAERWAGLTLGLGVGALGGAILGWPHAVPVGALAALSLAVVRIDGARFLIPDLLSLAIGALGLADAALGSGALPARMMTMLLMGLGLMALRAALTRWKGRTALGLGDVKLLVAAAAWLPASALPPFVFAAALSGLIEVLVMQPVGNRIAFGRHLAPWLCLAVLADPWLAPAIGTGGVA
jgi:leader peptidase (prepilin peptidase)/N-methyltransferase